MSLTRVNRVATLLALSLIAASVSACGSAGTVTSAAVSPPPSPAGSALALPPGFPIGTWTSTITAEDLEAVSDESLATIGMTRDNLVNENAGTFTTTFAADGTWSTVQDTDRPVKWPVFRGTLSPVGDDAFDQVTTFPPDFAGDIVRFTWQTVDGQLLLTVPDPPDPVLGVIMEAHPWSPAG